MAGSMCPSGDETKKLSFLTVLVNNCILLYFVKILMLMDGKCPYDYWPIYPTSGVCYNGKSVDQQKSLAPGPPLNKPECISLNIFT